MSKGASQCVNGEYLGHTTSFSISFLGSRVTNMKNAFYIAKSESS